MAVKIGILSVAHMHAWGYGWGLAKNPDGELVGVWDDNPERGRKFADEFRTVFFEDPHALLVACDGVIVTSENLKHVDHIEWALNAGKPVLCEKPIVASLKEAERLGCLLGAHTTASQPAGRRRSRVMTAFPCRYSPAFVRLKERIASGEIGKIKAICATNRGSCPFDWFVQPELSGGGAMIDHTVHVADLLRNLLAEEPESVQAQTGNNMYGQAWEDTAMLTLQFPSGVFATLDSSWSRPKSFKTWGDVTMNVVGEDGVIELDMFNQALDVYDNAAGKHRMQGIGSDLDALLVADFLKAVADPNHTPQVTGEDGIKAAKIALAGYESSRLGSPALACPAAGE